MMIKSGLRGAERIAELVQAMKSYSYLDQGVQQLVDVHQGLEDTLQILSHRLKPGIEVHRCYDHSLPQINAYGSELNQVWTHLIENAIDTKAVGEGTGLGLDIVRRIVENRHQGTIALESRPGETRFSIRLPLATSKPI